MVPPEGGRSLSGAVCSEQIRASEIGTAILARGGNAADAMIATTLAVNTLAPFHSDIGGGGFAIIRTPEGEYEGLDFRQSAPSDASMDFYKRGASTSVGGSAVAVPGEIRGLEELHKRYGRLPWSELFEPSIKLAREGMEMREDLRNFTMRECVPPGSDRIEGSFYEHDEMYHPLFSNGQVLKLDEKYVRSEYASTLEVIAQRGSEAFYEGEMAQAVVDAVRERGGLMSMEDLRSFQARWIKPISIPYRGYRLWTLPAPASGAIWCSAMGILGERDSAAQGSVLDYHRVTEALRLAYGQRTELGDPAFVPDVVAKQEEWLSRGYIQQRAEMLSDEKTFPPAYYLSPNIEMNSDNGTSNITAADETGLVVSLTTTVGLNWGSRIMVPGYGFVLNDSMDDFSVEGRPNQTGYEPTPANYVVGGKKPLSSSCPYIVEDAHGRVVLAGGAAGGSTIISANTQVAHNVLDHGMSASEALRANRLHNQILPNVSLLERRSIHQSITVDGFAEETARSLEGKGHKVEWVDVNRSTPCAMRFFRDEGKGGRICWQAAGDPRKADSGGSVFFPGDA